MVNGKWRREIIKLVMAVFALGLVGLAPFFRGLIFEREMSIHHYLAAMVSMLVLILLLSGLFNKGAGPTCSSNLKTASANGIAKIYHLPVQQLVISPYFLALAALTALYGLSFFQAINAREALFTWLRHLDYLLTFVLVFLALGLWEKDRQQTAFIRWFFAILAITGTVIAALGILTAQGIVSINGGIIFGRLCSTFLYPNSMAAYLMATLLMVIYLAVQNTRPLIAGLLAGMGFLTCLAIIGSQSRGVWAMLPLILVLWTLGQTARKRIVLLTAVLLGLALILSNLTVAPQLQQLQPNWFAFLCTLAGCLISGIAWAFCVAWQQKVSQTKKAPAILVGALCFILIIIAGAPIISDHPAETLNPDISDKTLLSRLNTTNALENGFQARLVYYADALKMVKDRPLLGWGGGGWKSGYPAFQSYNYISTTVHNHFLQVGVETGILGLIMLIIPFLFLSRSLWRLYRIRTTHALAPETWTIGTAALALGLHATIDFDLSFGSIALLFWALLALFAYREAVGHIASAPYLPGSDVTTGQMNLHPHATSTAAGKNFQSRNGYAGTVTPGLTMLLLLFLSLSSICLAAGTFTLRAAVDKAQAYSLAVQKGDEKAALEYIQVAIRLDRWSAQYPSAQAHLLIARIEHNPDQQAKKALALASLDLVRRAVQLDSYNLEHRFLLARLYLANGQLEKTLSEAAQAKALQPWFINTYEEFNSIYVNVAVQQLLRGQKEAAGITLRQVLTVTHEAITKKETLPPRLISLWDRQSDLSLTPALALTAGQAALLLEDYNQARDFLPLACQAEDQKAKAVAQLWLGIALQKSGDLSGATLQEKAHRTYPEVESEYAVIKILMGL